jgi:hypothetical protein
MIARWLGAAAFVCAGAAVSAAPVQIDYGDITAATIEDFEASTGLSGVTSANFNGFTLTVPASLRVVESNNLCGSSSNACALDNSIRLDADRVFDEFGVGTTAFGLVLRQFDPADNVQVTVVGGSGTSVFNFSAATTLVGFFDAAGLTSVTFNNFGSGPGAGNYTFDDVITSGPAVIPLPAGLPLLIGGLGALGIVARKRRQQTGL